MKRGNELFAREQYEAAIREYERLSPVGDRYARALYNIGVCHYELWHTDRAIDYYSRAIAIMKNNYPRASYALGVALEDLGRLVEARDAYKKTIADSGGNFAPAQFRLGVLLIRARDYPSAARLFKQATKQPGDHVPASHNNLGVILAWSGRLTEAEPEFEIALRLTSGTMEDAAHNLRLCRSLLSAETAKLVVRLNESLWSP